MSDEPMPCHAKMVDGRLCPRPAATCEWHPRDPLEAAMGDAMRRSLSEPGPVFPIDGERPSAKPLRAATVSCVGNFRVYFSSHHYAPLVWSVVMMTREEGVEVPAWEIAVRSVLFEKPSAAVYEPKATPDEVDGKPSAWIAVAGRLTVDEHGDATIGPA